MTIRLHPSRLHRPALQGQLTSAERGARQFQLGWPGLDPARPSLDIINFDHSGSVTEPGGADPIGNRFREADRAINTVRKWTTTDRPKVAIIHFDQPSTGNSGIVPLAAAGARHRLRTCLRRPSGAAGTSDLEPSLVEAEKLATASPDHDVRLIVLSDFALTDQDPQTTLQRLASFPGKVHAVVLGNAPPPLLTATDVTITAIHYTDPPGALARAIYGSLVTARRGARSPGGADIAT